MSSHPTRSTIGGSAYLDLQNLARLAASAYTSKLVLINGLEPSADSQQQPASSW
jgi:hypothetical protein